MEVKFSLKIVGVSWKCCFLLFSDETYGPISQTASHNITDIKEYGTWKQYQIVSVACFDR